MKRGTWFHGSVCFGDANATVEVRELGLRGFPNVSGGWVARIRFGGCEVATTGKAKPTQAEAEEQLVNDLIDFMDGARFDDSGPRSMRVAPAPVHDADDVNPAMLGRSFVRAEDGGTGPAGRGAGDE